MVELRHVRCLQLALQPALLRHSVMQPMFASMVMNNLTDKMIMILSTVICATSSDCFALVSLDTTCKEHLPGGVLTCQGPDTCLASSPCQDGEYCDYSHTCLPAGIYHCLPYTYHTVCICNSILHLQHRLSGRVHSLQGDSPRWCQDLSGRVILSGVMFFRTVL